MKKNKFIIILGCSICFMGIKIVDAKSKEYQSSTTPIYLEDYLFDASFNNIRGLSIQKYLSPNGNQVLARSSESILLLTFKDGLLIKTEIIDPSIYLFPYLEEEIEGDIYQARLISCGWFDESQIFITTDKQALLYDIETHENTIISADFKGASTQDKFTNYGEWVSTAYATGDYIVYQGGRPLENSDAYPQIYLANTDGEEMILEGYSIVLTNEHGFAYTEGNYSGGSFYGNELWWYDVKTKESYLIFEANQQETGLVIGDYYGDKQSYFDNPDLKFEEEILSFYVTDIATGQKVTYRYNTINHSLTK